MRAQTFSGRQGSQDAEELALFRQLLVEEKVKSYAEIGAREGDTFHAVMRSLPKGSRGIALDYPGAAWGKSTTRSGLERAVADLIKHGYDASCIFGDSRATATITQLRRRGPYDALFIDGDHRLPGVTADWDNYRSMARIIGFHDINGEGQKDKDNNPVQVHLLWQAIKESGARTVQFVTEGSTMGIGVVWTA